jgi:hypothetical protein
MSAVQVSNATVDARASAAMQRYLRHCADAIEQQQQHIDAINSGSLSPAAKRRALSKAHSRLADIQHAADLISRSTGAT